MSTEFILRKWEITDLDRLVSIADNSNIARWLTNHFPHPYTIESGKGFIEMASSGAPANILCIDINDQAVGAVGVHPKSDIDCKNAEMGYWLAEEFWGKGIMTNAIKEMCLYTFEHFEVERIYARPFGTNIGSIRALEKAGFSKEAEFKKTLFKDGTYHDEAVYAYRK